MSCPLPLLQCPHSEPAWVNSPRSAESTAWSRAACLSASLVVYGGRPWSARTWLIEHVDRLITEQGIDLYRTDFNIDPLSFWREHDTENRQGITENKYVTGFLAYLDELRRRHPDMLIDTCASGGRRNDLETLRRAAPLLRSDFIIDPIAQQNHTYGIAFWIPFYGTGVNAFDAYGFRSQMCPHLTFCYDMRRRDLDFASVRRFYRQWREVARYYWGDYYPLSPYSADRGAWVAWQFHRAALGEGMVQVFRREDSIYEAARVKLRGLDPSATYVVFDIDAPGKETRITGDALMQRGLRVEVSQQPGAVIYVYRSRQTD